MCNFIHTDHSIPKNPDKGFAWKIFETNIFDPERYSYIKSGYLMPMVADYNYQVDSDGWIYWKNSMVGDGFCALPTRKEAMRLNKAWKARGKNRFTVVRKIEYNTAVSLQQENKIMENYEFTVLIVKAFRIV